MNRSKPPLDNCKALPLGVFKIGIDAATFETKNVMGIGVIIRDCRGRFLAVRTRKVLGFDKAQRVDAMTIKEGLSLAKDLGNRVVILEGDAKIMLDSFECSLVDLSHTGLILAYAYRLTSRFNFFKA